MNRWLYNRRVRNTILVAMAVVFFFSSVVISYQAGKEGSDFGITGFATVEGEFVTDRLEDVRIAEIFVTDVSVPEFEAHIGIVNSGPVTYDNVVLFWTLVDPDDGRIVDSGVEEFSVPAASEHVKVVKPFFGKVGRLKLSAILRYTDSDSFTAFKLFSSGEKTAAELLEEYREEESVDDLVEDEPVVEAAAPPRSPAFVIWIVIAVLAVFIILVLLVQTHIIKTRIDLGSFMRKGEEKSDHRRIKGSAFDEKIKAINQKLK